jgi:glycosyltransferase involved in cell wall biosynthesis
MLGVFESHKKRAYGDKTIAVSKAIKNELLSFVGLSEEKVVPIHNGVDLSSFPEFQAAVKTKERAILSVGRFAWSKGHIFLIDAMPAVLSEYPDTKLWLVGEFLPTRASVPLQQHIKKLGIEKSVFFTGRVSKKRLNYLYHEAEVYVQPSLYEPFGITVLEAMSMRKPVIATSVGGIPEIIKNDREGILVEPRNSLQLAEAISEMLSDPSRRRKIGNNARKRVEEEFTWEKNASKTLKLYNHMI